MEPVSIRELDALKLQNAQLQFELTMERANRMVEVAQVARDGIVDTVCKPYIPEGKGLEDCTINLQKQQIEFREETPEDLPVHPEEEDRSVVALVKAKKK